MQHLQRNVSADERAERNVARFLKEVGPSMAVERLLSGYGRVRTRSAYVVELVEYKRWLAKEEVALGWDELPRDNLRLVYGASRRRWMPSVPTWTG